MRSIPAPAPAFILYRASKPVPKSNRHHVRLQSQGIPSGKRSTHQPSKLPPINLDKPELTSEQILDLVQQASHYKQLKKG